MKPVKTFLAVILAYVAIVAAFESMIGLFQPANASTLVISTTDEEGSWNDRVVAKLESDEKLYVAANHWPRAWYRQAIDSPNVEIALDPEGTVKTPYVAVPITGEERERVNAEHSLGLGFRFITGFPPRMLLRLDPR